MRKPLNCLFLNVLGQQVRAKSCSIVGRQLLQKLMLRDCQTQRGAVHSFATLRVMRLIFLWQK